MRIASLAVALACIVPWQGLGADAAHAAHPCRASVQTLLALPGRVDSLLAPAAGETIMALVGRAGSRIRFLPHDTLDLIRAYTPSHNVQPVPIPLYLAPPGMAAGPAGKRLYALVDSTLLTFDGANARLIARRNLSLQAIGWPAAIITGSDGDLFLVGQPAGSMEALAYAFKPDAHQVPRLLWRAPLGLTHAGTWIGLAGDEQLAVYVPDQTDTRGAIALLDINRGSTLGAYAVPMAPIAADVAQNRLYLAGAGTVRAMALRSGAPVAAVGGDMPLAAGGGVGLVAFVRGNQLVVARGDDLETVLTLPFPGKMPPTALAWQRSTLLVGNARGITHVSLDGCD